MLAQSSNKTIVLAAASRHKRRKHDAVFVWHDDGTTAKCQ
jgi:hypothetical protein